VPDTVFGFPDGGNPPPFFAAGRGKASFRDEKQQAFSGYKKKKRKKALKKGVKGTKWGGGLPPWHAFCYRESPFCRFWHHFCPLDLCYRGNYSIVGKMVKYPVEKQPLIMGRHW
jgi:hypothetical protein